MEQKGGIAPFLLYNKDEGLRFRKEFSIGGGAMEKLPDLFQNREPQLISEFPWKNHAVLFPFVETDQVLSLLFEVRSSHLRTQPGEISFPGGALEPGESAREAAIRETAEELLIRQNQIEVWGPGDIFAGPGARRIDSFVGKIQNYRNTYSREEVAEVFKIPFSELLQLKPQVTHNAIRLELDPDFPVHEIPNGKNYQWRMSEYRILFYRWKRYLIWGITARFLESLCEAIRQNGFKF